MNHAGKIVWQKGFTLIELLVVIAILAVLGGGLLIAIDPQDRINSANDSKVINDIGLLGRAAEAYSVANLGNYPTSVAQLVANGDLKTTVVPPSGYGGAYTVTTTPASCTGTGTAPVCTSVIFSGTLKSKKYTGASPATPLWKYDTAAGKSCAATTIAALCP